MYLNKINGIIPFTDKKISISLNSNDLIITGKNGSGKTQLLDTIFNVLSNAKNFQIHYLNYVKNQDAQKTSLESKLTAIKTNFENNKRNSKVHIETTESTIKTLNSRLDSIPTTPQNPNQKALLLKQIDQHEKQLEHFKVSITPETLQAQIDQQQTQFNNQE